MTAILPANFPAIAGMWKEFLAKKPQHGAIFLTPEWQQIWWEQFGNASQLCTFVIGDGPSPMGLAPLMRKGETLSFLGDTDLFDYHDFILGDCEPQAFYESLVRCLDGEPWKTFDLRSLTEHSPTLQHLPNLYGRAGYKIDIQPEDVAPGVQLPATWDDYLARLSKKDRHELRRKMRRLGEAGNAQVVLATNETMEQDINLFLSLMGESREEKREFMTPDREAFFRSMVETMNKLDVLRLFFLEIDGKKVAGVICFDYAGRRLLYNSGYRLAYRPYSVGLMLKALCLQSALESGMTYFDFLRGPEPYKYDLGAQDVQLFRLVVQR